MGSQGLKKPEDTPQGTNKDETGDLGVGVKSLMEREKGFRHVIQLLLFSPVFLSFRFIEVLS